MHVLEENEKGLSNQLEFTIRQGCIHLKRKKYMQSFLKNNYT